MASQMIERIREKAYMTDRAEVTDIRIQSLIAEAKAYVWPPTDERIIDEVAVGLMVLYPRKGRA